MPSNLIRMLITVQFELHKYIFFIQNNFFYRFLEMTSRDQFISIIYSYMF